MSRLRDLYEAEAVAMSDLARAFDAVFADLAEIVRRSGEPYAKESPHAEPAPSASG